MTRAVLPTVDAQAVTVMQGQRFVVDFHLPAVAVNRNPSDTVFFTLDGAGTGMATQGTAELLDGASVLGSDVSDRDALGSFPFYFIFTSSQLFQAPAPIVPSIIDGTALINRTIDGHLTVRFNADFTFDRFYLSTGQAIGGSAIYTERGYNAVNDGSRVEAITTVPEPQSYLLLAAGSA